ncbi:MAG: zf-HC2 domain-containing protein [Woeseiaceae bacterium]
MKNDIGCLDAIEAFYAYLDGELDDAGSIADFEHHLEHCRSCFTRIEMEKILSERMRRSARQESPQALRERVNKLMERFGEDSSG